MIRSRSNSGEGCIAVMQPYFFPYAGYFRLFAYCERVVLFDCVQFTRRSWISRNKFHKDLIGNLEWLNMPLNKSPRDSTIQQMSFKENAMFDLEGFMIDKRLSDRNKEFLFDISIDPCDLLERQIKWVLEILEIECDVIRSNSLRVDEDIRGQNRVLEIAKRLDASCYVNLSGGVDLYEPERFAKAGLNLKILKPYSSSDSNILDRIVSEPKESIYNEILREIAFL